MPTVSDRDPLIQFQKLALASQLPRTYILLAIIANSLLARARETTPHGDFEQAILLLREALRLHPIDHPQRFTSLNNLAVGLYLCFEQCGMIETLDEVVCLHREALKTISDDHYQRPILLNNLACTINTRVKYCWGDDTIDEAILLQREALYIHSLSNSHHPRSEIPVLYRELLGSDPTSLDFFHCVLRSNLANFLLLRFTESQTISNLEESITLQEEALELCTSESTSIHQSARSMALDGLGVSLIRRYQSKYAQDGDLDKCISLLSESLHMRLAPHPERSTTLHNLGCALASKFATLSDQGREQSEEAMNLLNESYALRPMGHPERAVTLGKLGNIMLRRYEFFGSKLDLEESLKYHRASLILFPEREAAKYSEKLNDIAHVLMSMFRHSGRRADLDEAIFYHREAVRLNPERHGRHSVYLDTLGFALQHRYVYSNGEQLDLDEALVLHRQALNLRPAPHPARFASLNNLGLALHNLFKQSKLTAHLEESIDIFREAIALTPSNHRARMMLIHNLGMALCESSQYGDLDEAVSLLQECLSLIPDTHPHRCTLLNNLAKAMLKQAENLPPSSFNNISAVLDRSVDEPFYSSQMRQKLDDAINFHRLCSQSVDSSHPFFGINSRDMGKTLLYSYSQFHQLDDLNAAMTAFKDATECLAGSILTQFEAARLWASYADRYHDPSALDGYTRALQLLPRLSSLEINFKNRQKALANTDGLAREAALFAIHIGKYQLAIEWLEAGRAVFWMQALQLRTPMDDLHEVAPNLAASLSSISKDLEFASHLDYPTVNQNKEKQEFDNALSQYHRLTEKWDKTLEEVQKLDGFEDFLKPKKITALQMAAQDGPIIVLIPGDSVSHALIMTSSDVQHVPLQNINVKDIKILSSQLRACAPAGSRQPHSISDDIFEDEEEEPPNDPQRIGRPAAPQHMEAFGLILGRLWEAVVEPVVRHLNLKKSEYPPHIRWCPTGLLSFLPFHAAGIYSPFDMSSPDCASDYLVSSYAPTIGSLLLKRQQHSPDSTFKMMVAIEPKTLPSTILELQNIVKYVPPESLIKLGIPGAPSSAEAVLKCLSTVSIAHFACHGKQDSRMPLDSALVLDDGDLKMSRMLRQVMPNASLAFLCACETAMGTDKLPDESMHLGAMLLFFGFQNVIATMWSINDRDGPVVADAFYKYFFGDGFVGWNDSDKAARAIHSAAMNLRSQNASFKRWVPFIHLGG